MRFRVSNIRYHWQESDEIGPDVADIVAVGVRSVEVCCPACDFRWRATELPPHGLQSFLGGITITCPHCRFEESISTTGAAWKAL